MAITKPPRRNLPPDAEKWGRHTDDALRQAQVDIEALRRDLTAGFRATNSSLNRVVKQQQTLIDQQAQLSAQQATLQSQQDQLQSQQDQILTLIANMTWAVRSGGSIVDESVGVNERVFIRQQFTVPAGYARAVTFGVMNAKFNNSTSNSDWLHIAVRTNLEPPSNISYPAPPTTWTWGGASGSRVVEGLSPGQTLTIDAMGRAQEGNVLTSGTVILDSLVIFTK